MSGTVHHLCFALICFKAFCAAAPLSEVVNVSSTNSALIYPSATRGSVVTASASQMNATTVSPGSARPTITSGIGPLPGRPCPARLKVCWEDNPPYFIKRNRTGVFTDVIQDTLNKCCDTNDTVLDFMPTAVTDDAGLQNCTYSPDVELTFPVRQRLPNNIPGRFIRVVQSPGIALVLNGKKLQQEAQKNVWNDLLQIWTVLVLAMLLAVIFGIVIWGLDHVSNPDNFPPEFPRGATEGIWWAFVTMTTVGYGDKAPKNIFARIFAIVWMFIGLGLVSLITATMTSSLTLGEVAHTKDVFDKKIGVLDGGQGYEEGIKQGADVQKYETLEQLYSALVDSKVDGIMLDVFKASYSSRYIEETGENLVMPKMFEFPFVLGFYVGPTGMQTMGKQLVDCLDSISSASFQSEVYHTVRKYVRGAALKDIDRETSNSRSAGSWQTRLNIFSTESELFYRSLMVLGSVLGGLLVLGFIHELLKRNRRKTRTLNNNRNHKNGSVTGSSRKLPTSSLEFRRMMDNLYELETSLTKISEFKELYHKLKTDMEHLDYDKSRSNTTTKNTGNKSYTNIRLEHYRPR